MPRSKTQTAEQTGVSNWNERAVGKFRIGKKFVPIECARESNHLLARRANLQTPANALSLPAAPPGVTGIFGSHVVAVDATSGAVIGGWSCAALGPAQFDGSYEIDRLSVGHSYTVYAEPLNGVVDPSQISNATATLCRNSTTDAGWPPLQGCIVPEVNVTFTTRTRPGA